MMPTRMIAAAVVVLGLGGCSLMDRATGAVEAEPVGVGGHPDELKRSPCACVRHEQQWPPGWREDLERRLSWG